MSDTHSMSQAAEHPTTQKAPTPGFKSTLVSEENFLWLKRLQRTFPEPWLDLKYVSDAAIAALRQMPRESIEPALLKLARDSMRRHLQALNQPNESSAG